MMENILEYRHRVGVPDAILLEDFQSEDAFIENLRKRYSEDIIYTYIGHVLVSVNPYTDLSIYEEEFLEKYRKVNFYEVPPHSFALSERAYRAMSTENQDQCILISGESGAGKTEASKHVLQYIVATSQHCKAGDKIRDRLLKSNPLLEGFGNAKTSRNDNSSRFGKYMDIECDYKGDPIGGHIFNYLLEKSRVIHQEKGERNFHIFYQLITGAEEGLLHRLHLTRSPKDYYYLRQGFDNGSDSINDLDDYKAVISALDVIDFDDKEKSAVWRVVAGILHLGNVAFTRNQLGHAMIVHPEDVERTSQMFECDEADLAKALTSRTIETKHDLVTSPLDFEQAMYARDALAKSVYERLFNWLVARVNQSLQKDDNSAYTNLIGILDIYGFEIFDNNGFEQFCINYCNEKLQQVFIELTLRSEQEEYCREGIHWEKIDYFDNKIICNLIEEKHKGIISMLDEECLRPGNASDFTFLAKMDSSLSSHKHYLSYRTINNNKVRNTFNSEEFRIRHYAGDVAYSIKGFLDKNNDLLYRDLKGTMSKSKHLILSKVFHKRELVQLKRPETSTTQFKTSLSHLMDTLMTKDPSYIRCIKPNDLKKAASFNTERIRHQVKYLGLMENVRVRRAGFAYRRKYDIFLQRYKSLCPDTWPQFNGLSKQGVQAIVDHLKFDDDEYQMGETKIFIRLPETLFRTEDAFQKRKHELANLIQARWKGRYQRKAYLRMVEAVTVISKNWRRVLAMRERALRKRAFEVIRKFIRGYITRDGSLKEENAQFQQIVKRNWLLRLSKNLPKSVLWHQSSWPVSPKSWTDASELLRKIHCTYLARKYVWGITRERKYKFMEKVKAEQLFKDKKANYATTFPFWFKSSRLSLDEDCMVHSYFDDIPEELLKYVTPCTKFDRHGYRERSRIFALSTAAIYQFEIEKRKIRKKERHHLNQITRIVVSPNSDGFMLLEVRQNYKEDKGDMIMSVPSAIEAVTKMIMETGHSELLYIMDSETCYHTMKNGRQGTIVIDQGPISCINKNKEGQLVVVGGQ